MKLIRIIKWILVISLLIVAGACAVNKSVESIDGEPVKSSDHYKDGLFYNAVQQEEAGIGKMISLLKRFFIDKRVDSMPLETLPIKTVSREQLDALSNTELHLIKLGHSTFLMKVYGEYWLIDPVFSLRASPFSFIGPIRFHPSPITVAELPPITRVLISHNHYDHLDKVAIKQLVDKTEQFLVPLGIEGDLRNWGVDPEKVIRFDWWQEYETKYAKLVFTPSQHFSGRGLNDRNKTLWGGWAILTEEERIYYTGDSGYFDGFKEIGQKLGPFDLTLIETGAYNSKDWPDIHLLPEQSVQAHIDLRGATLLPVHNSTFDLSFHPWYEPLDRVSAEAKRRNVPLTTPVAGEVFSVKKPAGSQDWWLSIPRGS